MSSRPFIVRTVALLAGLALAAAAAAADLQLVTEAELRGNEMPQRIEAFWRSRQADASFTGRGGLVLHGLKFVQQPASARGAIVLVSGRTESVRKYKETVYDLWRSGYAVYLYDHRGQGRSERERNAAERPQMGHVNRFDDYVDDLQTFVATRVLPDGHRKHYLLAHSMGGAIAARYLETAPAAQLQRIAAAVLMSPMLQISGLAGLPADMFSCHLAAMGVALGQATRYRVGGKDYAPREFEGNPFTSSRERHARMLEEYARPPDIRIGAQSWGWIDQACKGAALAREQAAQVRTPVLVIVAGSDSIVHNDGAVTFCERRRGCDGTPDRGPLRVAGARHELMIESDEARGQALRAAVSFFDQH